MAQFKQWFTQDLTESIVVRHCESVMFTGDDNGAVVGVRLYDNGEAYSGGGTVSGAVKRYDGGLVPLTGTLSGNAASVVIPAVALAYPGPIGVHVVLTQGGSVTTVLKAIYSVDDNSGAAVDPGTIIPSINDLITAINNAVASIPSDYSALLHTLAPDFSASTAYAAGDYVWYNGTLYCFTANHAAGSWTGTDATAAVVGNDLSNLKSAIENVFDPSIVIESGTFYDPDGKTKVNNVRRLRNAEIIPTIGLETITFNSAYSAWIFYLNAAQQLITTSGVWVNPPIIASTLPDGTKYINIAIRKTNASSSDISGDAESFSSSVSIRTLPMNIEPSAETVHKTAKAYQTKNFITGWIYDGKTMQLDGSITDSATWCRSNMFPVSPGTEYKIVSFYRKNKQISNSYFNYFDEYGVRLSSTQKYDTTTVSIPAAAYYCVISCSITESKYLTLSVDYPMWYIGYGQDGTFNVKTRYNRSAFSDTINWAKNGVNTLAQISGAPIYPHGCKWSIIAAMYTGFDAILIDLVKTSDGKFVISHEDNIVALAKNADGTALASGYKISEHTLAEVQALDFGYDYGIMYRGTKILSIDEALLLIKRLGLNLVVEPISSLTTAEYADLAKKVAQYGFTRNVIFFGYSSNKLAAVTPILPEAGLMLYVGGNASYIDALITDAIGLKTDKNKVICNAFANTTDNTISAAQVQRMIDNGLLYSVSTPQSEPDGFITFMNTAPMASYATLFGSQAIPANRMLIDSALE